MAESPVTGSPVTGSPLTGSPASEHQGRPGFRLEFFVEPFEAGRPGPHVKAAIEAVANAGLEVQVGPFSNTTGGEADQLADAAAQLLKDAIAQGATRVSLQITSDQRAGPIGLADLHDALRRLITRVESELGGSLPELSREKKQAAVRLLDELGAFLLRRSIDDVADAMGVSRITIYNYLNAVNAR